MVLTFKSTKGSAYAERVLLERDNDGNERIVHAVQEHGNTRNWKLKLTHPSGMMWLGNFNGDGNEVGVAMTQLLMDKEQDYREEKARGHRPAPAHRDVNARVNEYGADVGAPIKTIWER